MSTHQRQSLGPHGSLMSGDDDQARSSGDGGFSMGGKKEEAHTPTDPDEVEGSPLTAYLQSTATLSADWCVELFSQLCDAVQSFHDKEIFHLSLQSDKLLVFQMPKLAEVDDLKTEKKEEKEDSGEKKSLGPAPPLAEHAPLVITRYTAPEVLRGEPPSVRSDVYSLAAIFYEVLAQRPFAVPLVFPEQDERFKPYEWEALQDVLDEALQDDPLDRFESIEEFWDELQKTRRDPNKEPPSTLQETRKKIQDEMVGYVRKSVSKEALKKTMGWMRGGPGGGMGGGMVGHDHTLANEIVQVVIKEIFGAMMKNASITAKGALDRKLKAASAKRDAWLKRVVRVAGKSVFLVGMVIGMVTGGGTKIVSWFRKPATAQAGQAGLHKKRYKKKKLPLTMRAWRYFFPKKKNQPLSKNRPLPRKQQGSMRPKPPANKKTSPTP